MAHNQSDIAIITDLMLDKNKKAWPVVEKQKFNNNPAPRDMKWIKGVLLITPKIK